MLGCMTALDVISQRIYQKSGRWRQIQSSLASPARESIRSFLLFENHIRVIRTAIGEIHRVLRRFCCARKSRELTPINGGFARSALGVRGVFAPLLVSHFDSIPKRHEDVSHSESFAKSFRNFFAICVHSRDSRAEFGCGGTALRNPRLLPTFPVISGRISCSTSVKGQTNLKTEEQL